MSNRGWYCFFYNGRGGGWGGWDVNIDVIRGSGDVNIYVRGDDGDVNRGDWDDIWGGFCFIFFFLVLLVYVFWVW